jgi:hypothetical protein
MRRHESAETSYAAAPAPGPPPQTITSSFAATTECPARHGSGERAARDQRPDPMSNTIALTRLWE